MRRGRPKKMSDGTTLKKLGISRDQSSQWQQMARISKETFEAYLAQAEMPSATGLQRFAALTGEKVVSTLRRQVMNSEIVVRDQREPGWFHLDNEIVDQYGARLGAYGISVYAVLCRRCTASQEVRSLSQRDIAATLRISQDRVRKSLADLTDLGLIQIDTPEHPAPGVIATIRLLKVKATERHTFGNKECKV